jgi:hypothetical protein
MTPKHEEPSQLPAGRVIVSEDVLLTSMNDVVLMLDVKCGVYYELGGTGGRVWNLLAQNNDLESVVNSLVDEFDVEPVQARADVAQMVQDLVENGLATIANAS